MNLYTTKDGLFNHNNHVYDYLEKRIGKSATTTYLVLRNKHNQTAQKAWEIANQQKNLLGDDYPGGIDCIDFRN